MPPSHVLMIGGTGMLAPVTPALVSRGARVSMVSRLARGPDAYSADWTRPGELRAAAEAAVAASGPVDLVVAWVHAAGAGECEPVAAALLEAGSFIWVDVLGSAADAPGASPGWRVAARPGLTRRRVVLGWIPGQPVSRWLTHREIAAGVLEALDAGAEFWRVGVTRPWSARP